MTPSEIAGLLDVYAAEARYNDRPQTSANLSTAAATIRAQTEALKIATEALERFDSAYVIEPNGAIIGLERWHLEGVKQALARIKEAGL